MVRLRHLAGCALVLMVVGCGSSTGGTATTSTANGSGSVSAASAAPTTTDISLPAFDGCKDVPDSLLAELGIERGAASEDTRGVFRWKGCQYQKSEVYTFDVESTNMTVDQLAQHHDFTLRRFRILGRTAASDGPKQSLSDPAGNSCVVLVAINGGGVYVHLSNSALLTAAVDPCQTATDLATKIVAALPAGS